LVICEAVMEDEHLQSGQDIGTSRILLEEIERPRVGPMRDIVAAIQPEQDVLQIACTTNCL